MLPQIKAKTDLGLAIFQLKKAVKDHDFAPARLQLAEALRLSDQPEEAEKTHIPGVGNLFGRATSEKTADLPTPFSSWRKGAIANLAGKVLWGCGQ